MSDDIYILGINMTRFGKHPDADSTDLGAEAALAALADGGVGIADWVRQFALSDPAWASVGP